MIFDTTLPHRWLVAYRIGTTSERMIVRRAYTDMRRHGISRQGARLHILDLFIVGRHAGPPTVRTVAA